MKVIFIILSMLLPVVTYAQSITGKLIDTQNQPVPFANVITLAADSAFIAGTVSNDDGSFEVTANPNAALLKVSYIGYQEVILPIENKSDMGIIRLQEESTLLGEVVVKGTIPVTRIKGDAMVTTIENSVLADVGSAKDVLSKVPGLVLKKGEMSDAFEVLGKGAPLIYINGREVRNQSELEQLNSDEIKNVELITNPGARYDASVKAVVRIQTVKRQGDGFGFDLRSSYIQSENTDLIEQLNFNYRHNNFDLFGTVNYNRFRSEMNTDISEERKVSSDLWNQTDHYDTRSANDNIEAVLGMNYMINENHSIGVRYDLTSTLKNTMEKDMTTDVIINGQFNDRLLTDGFDEDDYKPGHQLNAYYNGRINDLAIDFNADYFRENYEKSSLSNEKSQEQEDRIVRALNPVDNQLAATKLIFSHPLWGGSISFGSEYSYSFQTNDYLSANEEYVPTSYSKIKEHNIAVFAEYNHDFSFGQIAAGVRYEHVIFDYFENHEFRKDESRKYDNIFPNASFNTQLGPIQTQLSYTAKTQRPSYWSLRKNVSYHNRFTLQTGDPTLKPTIIHDVTLTNSWRFLQLMVSFQQNRDAVVPWEKPMEGNPEITMLQPINLHKLPMLSAYISATPTIDCWSPMLTLGITKQWLTIESGGLSYEMNRPMFTGTFYNILNLPKGFAIGADFTYQGKGDYNNSYYNKSVWFCNVSLRKSFLNEALEIELRGNDIFKTMKSSTIYYFENQIGEQMDKWDSREFVLTLRYKFNMTPSKYKGTGAGAEQKSRF